MLLLLLFLFVASRRAVAATHAGGECNTSLCKLSVAAAIEVRLVRGGAV